MSDKTNNNNGNGWKNWVIYITIGALSFFITDKINTLIVDKTKGQMNTERIIKLEERYGYILKYLERIENKIDKEDKG